MNSPATPSFTPSPLPPSDGDHSSDTRRIFIGPMPESVVDMNALALVGDDGDSGMTGFVREHAFDFFLRHGGKHENWGEAAERSVHEEMMRRWRASAWGTIRRRRRRERWQPLSAARWVGGTFEIGDTMGVNVLHESPSSPSPSKASTTGSGLSVSPSKVSTTGSALSVSPPPSPSPISPRRPPSSALDTFLTARSTLSPSIRITESLISNHVSDDSHPISASSSTPLLLPNVSNALSPSHLPSRGAKSDGDVRKLTPPSALSGPENKGKGKGKAVHYADEVTEPPVEEPPASPSEVLLRTGSAVQESSAGATADAENPSISEESKSSGPEPSEGVIMRDRMLVRVSHAAHENIGKSFDEAECRTTRGLRHQVWAEFMVVWRNRRIELYEDYSMPGKEWAIGHKRLAFLVHLYDRRTRLSLFSPVDLSFCLVCPPSIVRAGRESKQRSTFLSPTQGLNIFVFKPKSRSRAVDWMWHLWMDLGGEIPSTLDIHCPVLETRVKIDVPSISNDDYSEFNRESVIDVCERALSKLQGWEPLIQQPITKGKRLELCWRTESKLDWVWLENDIDGNRRDWAVLFGFALKIPGRPSHLEIRLGDHYSQHVTLKDGTQLHEPPAIEGYLYRIKPNSQTRAATVYLASHDGCLFSLPLSRAHLPTPPGVSALVDAEPDARRQAEILRGQDQILDSDGFWDLRSIVAVRQAFQVVPNRHNSQDATGIQGEASEEVFWGAAETRDSDDEDEGGDEGLSKAQDKGELRVRRSFELLLSSGRVVRFETYSRKVATEWVTRLRALAAYWTQRNSADASAEMELLSATTGRQRLSLKNHTSWRIQHAESPAGPDGGTSLLGPFWHWCVLDGCRPIVKSGRVFAKKGLRGQYTHMQLILVSGHLAQFRLTRHAHMYHHRSQTINLLDLYVCSGYFAALALPPEEYDPNAPPVAKLFQDGLETVDSHEDTMFILWYRPHATRINAYANDILQQGHSSANDVAVPPLSAKRKLLVCHARSKLERDAWCWALNCEIERVVRATKTREQKAREDGALTKL